MLVDDAAAVRAAPRSVLGDAGHAVVGEAADGRAGVRETRARRPDLVIMDWQIAGHGRRGGHPGDPHANVPASR